MEVSSQKGYRPFSLWWVAGKRISCRGADFRVTLSNTVNIWHVSHALVPSYLCHTPLQCSDPSPWTYGVKPGTWSSIWQAIQLCLLQGALGPRRVVLTLQVCDWDCLPRGFRGIPLKWSTFGSNLHLFFLLPTKQYIFPLDTTSQNLLWGQYIFALANLRVFVLVLIPIFTQNAHAQKDLTLRQGQQKISY